MLNESESRSSDLPRLAFRHSGCFVDSRKNAGDVLKPLAFAPRNCCKTNQSETETLEFALEPKLSSTKCQRPLVAALDLRAPFESSEPEALRCSL